MFLAALLMVSGGALYRLDAFLIIYEPGNGWSYFPSVPEIMVTVGVISRRDHALPLVREATADTSRPSRIRAAESCLSRRRRSAGARAIPSPTST